MPKKKTAYEKIISLCNKYEWLDPPFFEPDYNYDKIFDMLYYSPVKIEIGKTHSPETWEDYYELLNKYKTFRNSVTLERLIFTYGVENGTKRYETYREQQALTNTFEYKKLIHGFTEEQFNEYNKSRAVTLENMIKKYGVKKGTEKYDNYCKRQSYTNTEEYLGPERYKKANRLKSHTLSVYIERYGPELAEEKLLEFFEKSNISRYSKVSQELFSKIEPHLTEYEKKYSYYAEKNKEYALIHEDRCYLYDYVCACLKFCIEYHGDHYHGNPLIYKPDDYLRGRNCTKIKAKEKWEDDNKKAEILKNKRGYDVLVIWDSDWKKNSNEILDKLILWIEQRRNQLYCENNK